MPSSFTLLPLMLPALAGTAELQVGDTAPALSLNDQHDTARTTLSVSRFLLFSADKDGSNLADAVLEGQTGETMEQAGIAYVADISAMPAMVTKMFAMPKLRKRPYPVLLGRAAEDTMNLPRQAGQVTVIELNGESVASIAFMSDVSALRARLGLTA
ncbi:hypothetical protein [Allochromatium vinosum]|uniref:FAD/FMN-containing dehydrogenase n=1 Tax=Allochromatium vinosum (strain ATCC 17899 / DSM 180 / NBRC 103801 / NCIMB 10441 / D) TaxID=572477 RepID=D3RSU1_ALLVD|nr:hypothetical protein [Allochromatium vinosum]ADC62250.1 conserved hypothetical protein [Allochromatium vinosum DSM 180]MBK1653532.1 hypothetical protein [Allochromatium vinosum]